MNTITLRFLGDYVQYEKYYGGKKEVKLYPTTNARPLRLSQRVSADIASMWGVVEAKEEQVKIGGTD